MLKAKIRNNIYIHTEHGACKHETVSTPSTFKSKLDPHMSVNLTDSQTHILEALVTISGSLSIVATLFVIWTYVHYKEVRIYHLRLILNLAIVDCCS